MSIFVGLKGISWNAFDLVLDTKKLFVSLAPNPSPYYDKVDLIDVIHQLNYYKMSLVLFLTSLPVFLKLCLMFLSSLKHSAM